MTEVNISTALNFRRVPMPSTRPDDLPPGTWAQALHDYQRREFFRADLGYSVPRSLAEPKDKLDDQKGFPEMVPFDPRIGVKLTEPIQWFWVRQLVLSMYGLKLGERYESGSFISIAEDFRRRLSTAQADFIKNAWRGLTKSFTAFTNGKGTDVCKDYINRVNLSKEYPILWENTTGGSLLRLESRKVYRQGYKVLTLSPSRFVDWREWTFIDHPQYFTRATNSTPFGFNGQWTERGPWRVDPFHYLSGRDVPVPIMSNTGYVYVRTDRARIMENGETFPPRYYNP